MLINNYGRSSSKTMANQNQVRLTVLISGNGLYYFLIKRTILCDIVWRWNTEISDVRAGTNLQALIDARWWIPKRMSQESLCF